MYKNTKKNNTIKNSIKNSTKKKVYTKKDFKSGDGMLTSVWGPGLWHYLQDQQF